MVQIVHGMKSLKLSVHARVCVCVCVCAICQSCELVVGNYVFMAVI